MNSLDYIYLQCMNKNDVLQVSVQERNASKGPSRRSSMAISVASNLNGSQQSGLNRSRQSGLNRSRQDGLNRSRQDGLNKSRQSDLNKSRQDGLNKSRQSGLNKSRQSGLHRSRQSGLTRSHHSLNGSNQPSNENAYCRGENASNRLLRNSKLDNLLGAVIKSKLASYADNQNIAEASEIKPKGSVSSRKSILKRNFQDLHADASSRTSIPIVRTQSIISMYSAAVQTSRHPSMTNLVLPKSKTMQSAAIQTSRHPSLTTLEAPESQVPKIMQSAGIQTSRHPSMTSLESSKSKLPKVGPKSDEVVMPVHNYATIDAQINPSTISIPSAVSNDFTLVNDNLMTNYQPPARSLAHGIVQLNQPSQMNLPGSKYQTGRRMCVPSGHQASVHIPTTPAYETADQIFTTQTANQNMGQIFETSAHQKNGQIFGTSEYETQRDIFPTASANQTSRQTVSPVNSSQTCFTGNYGNATLVQVRYGPASTGKNNIRLNNETKHSERSGLNTSESTSSSTATPDYLTTRPLPIGEEYPAINTFSTGFSNIISKNSSGSEYKIVYVYEDNELKPVGKGNPVSNQERFELRELRVNNRSKQEFDLRANVPLQGNPDDSIRYNEPLRARNREVDWVVPRYNATGNVLTPVSTNEPSNI